jgi:serine protease Do
MRVIVAGLFFGALLAKPGSAVEPNSKVKEATAQEVRTCKPLGEIVGESRFCIKSRAKESALEQAGALGATHIIWLNVRCVPFAGERASARIFDCSSITSLDETFEDYLAENSKLASETVRSKGIARIMTSRDLDADAADLVGRGYALVGYAGAAGGRIPLETIRKKAGEVGAEIVLIHSKSTGEDVEYQAVTSYHGGGAGLAVSSTYGAGSVGGTSVQMGGSGVSITGTPGSTHTEMVPFSQRRYETQALFWRKLRPGPLGLFLDLIPAEMRTRLARNTGAFVVAVEAETPGFFANIVAGDIIIAVDGHDVRTPKELAALVEKRGSLPLKVRVLRKDTILEVEVKD